MLHRVKPRIITITVSDTRTAANDFSGKALAEELASFERVRHCLVRDEEDCIAVAVADAAADADAVIVTGGTGISPRDVTYEAVVRLFDKELPGFGEAFRSLSWKEVGARAMLSRVSAGTIGTTIVFLLPGSEKAARFGARELILPMLAHAVDLLTGKTAHG
jgi:molybdopterin adenylyltransferase